MNLNVYRTNLEEALNSETSLKENQTIMQQIQITDMTVESGIETKIKEANQAKAEAEAEKVKVETELSKIKAEAEIEKLKAETKTAKAERIAKIGGLMTTVFGTVVTAVTLIFVNGMNIESHRREEMKYSDSEKDCERNITNKVLDLFIKRK